MALKAQVSVGQIWTARISGRMTRVKIARHISTPGYFGPSRTYWEAINLSTGKTVRIKSAMKLRLLEAGGTPETQDDTRQAQD